MRRACGVGAIVALALGCGASPARPSHPAPESSLPLMLGVATVTDGRQGFSNAFFFNVEPEGERCAPVDVTVGPGAVCTVRDCRTAGTEPPTRLVDVGDVIITSPVHPLTRLRRDDGGLYALDGETGLRWLSGDAVRVEIAGGADGPAASADLVVPIQPELLAPAVPAGDEVLGVSRARPLEVRWTPFEGTAHVYLGQFENDPGFWLRHVEVECLADGADGGLAVPIEILARFVPSTDALLSNFALGARTWVDVRTGDRTLRFVAQTGRSIWVRYL